MNKFFRRIKSIFYSLPFGLKGADTEIMGADSGGNGNDTVVKQQVSDKRVAKHLLKGEVTKEVEELRYRTYKVDREADKYDYVGAGMSIKKDKPNKNLDIIKFTQENKLVCEDVLSELNRVDSFGFERYSVEINYAYPVRFKLQEFLLFVDVYIKKGEKAITTLRFSDTRNPSAFNSKPFVTELEKLKELFDKNDTYGLSRNDFATAILCMNFTTFKASDSQPDIVSYGFISPELIGVHHENGEYKLVYQWKDYNRLDLTEKFYNAELEEKYKNKEKKEVKVETEITKDDGSWWEKHQEKTIPCVKCGNPISTYRDGYIIDEKTGEPMCLKCYEKSLLEITK